MKLAFGVEDIPYAMTLKASAARTLRWRLRKKPWQSVAGTIKTGDVAEILEKRYKIFETFYEMHQDFIMEKLEEAVRVKLENSLMGAPGDADAPMFGEAELTAIEERFKKFIDDEELASRVPGVPTKAALAGHNARLAHPYAKNNPRRPSFIMTGLYQSTAKVWVTD